MDLADGGFHHIDGLGAGAAGLCRRQREDEDGKNGFDSHGGHELSVRGACSENLKIRSEPTQATSRMQVGGHQPDRLPTDCLELRRESDLSFPLAPCHDARNLA